MRACSTTFIRFGSYIGVFGTCLGLQRVRFQAPCWMEKSRPAQYPGSSCWAGLTYLALQIMNHSFTYILLQSHLANAAQGVLGMRPRISVIEDVDRSSLGLLWLHATNP